MLKAADNECEEAPEYHDQLAGVRLAAEAAPDRQTNKHVAEYAANQKRNEGHHHLRGCCRGKKGGCRLIVQPGEMKENRKKDRSGQIADPADNPQLHSLGNRDLLLEDARCHDQVVAGKQLRSRNNDQRQRNPEGRAHGKLRRRRPRQLASDRIDQQIAEADIGPRCHSH